MRRAIWAVGSISSLFICFLIIRPITLIVFGNSSFPGFLFFLCLLPLIISIICDARKMMICIVAGYSIGFALGVIFGEYRFCPYQFYTTQLVGDMESMVI